MRDENLNSDLAGSDDVDLNRREVLASLAKYSATVAGASAVVLTASASVSLASVSGDGNPGRGRGRHHDRGGVSGHDKPVGRSPFNGRRGQVPSGKIK